MPNMSVVTQENMSFPLVATSENSVLSLSLVDSCLDSRLPSLLLRRDSESLLFLGSELPPSTARECLLEPRNKEIRDPRS